MASYAVISVLTRSLLAGEPTLEAAHARVARILGRSWRWLRPLVERYVDAFGGPIRPRHRDVVSFLLSDQEFSRACAKYRHEVVIAEWLAEPQRSGGVRLLESPKSRLKQLQRRILTGIRDPIPAHPAAHGFVEGRSIVTFASPHASKQVLLRLDLQDFFPSFPAARIHALFRTLG